MFINNKELRKIYEQEITRAKLLSPTGKTSEVPKEVLKLLEQREMLLAKINKIAEELQKLEEQDIELKRKLQKKLEALGKVELYFEKGGEILKYKIAERPTIQWAKVVEKIKKLNAKNKKLLQQFEEVEKEFSFISTYLGRYSASSESPVMDSRVFMEGFFDFLVKLKDRIFRFIDKIGNILREALLTGKSFFDFAQSL